MQAGSIKTEIRRHASLIVLIPPVEFDPSLAAAKIWETAHANTINNVLLVGLCDQTEHEPAVRRNLVTLAALVGINTISIDTKIGYANNWLSIVRNEWREGDLITYFSDTNPMFSTVPLGELIEKHFTGVICRFSALRPIETYTRPEWLTGIELWLGFLAIVLGFFWVQARLSLLPHTWFYEFLLSISIVAEFFTLSVWNTLFS